MIALWLGYFVTTLAVEVPLVMLVLAGLEPAPPHEWQRRLRIAIGVNVLTHPLVFLFLFRVAWPQSRELRFVLGEGFAVVAEAVLYRLSLRRCEWSLAFAVSAFANAGSVVVSAWLAV